MSNESVVIEAHGLSAAHLPDAAPSACGVTVTCHDTVPPSLETELEGLYHHINSSLCHHAVARRARGAQAYVARRGVHPVAIFLFRREGRSILVLNEMMRIAPEELERFAASMFSRFPAVARISFSKIGKEIGTLSRPWQQYKDSEDIVVSLPATQDAYFASLGAKLRHNIRHQMKAICADFPGFSFETREHAAITADHVASLIRLKKSSFDEKHMKCGITPEERAWLIERATTHGLLVVALFEGAVCGGSLSLRLGDHYFAHLNGYDTRFAKYSLGMLCCYRAMNEKIARGAKEAHLSWGRNPYKFKLLGVQRDMANVDIYRSRWQYYRHGNRVVMNALCDAVDRQKRRIMESGQGGGMPASLAGRIVKTLQRLKRSTFRPAA